MPEINQDWPEIKAVLQPKDARDKTSWLSLLSAYQECLKLIDENIKNKRAKLAFKIKKLKAKAKHSGRSAGMRQAASEKHDTLEACRKLYIQTVKIAQHDCLKLAECIATEVLHEKIKISHKGMAKKIKSILESFTENEITRIQTSSNSLQGIQAELNHDSRVQADSKVANGDAVFVTDSGQIELSWKKHLEHVCKDLHEEMSLIYKK